MRRDGVPAALEAGRVRIGPLGSDAGAGFYGHFVIQGPCGEKLMLIASAGEDRDAEGWEHVSVSTRRRVPNWREMCFVKGLFWGEEEWVVQFHPARSEYVNLAETCLHLFRHKGGFPTPPSKLVGPVGSADLPDAASACHGVGTRGVGVSGQLIARDLSNS